MKMNNPDKAVAAKGAALNDALVQVAASGGTLGCRIENMLSTAMDVFQRAGHAPAPNEGLIRQLQNLDQGRLGHTDQQRLVRLIKDLRAYFSLADPNDPDTNDGQVRFFTTADKLRAFMCVLPPRGDGSLPTLNTVTAMLARAGIVQGVDFTAVEQALERLRLQTDIVWNMPVAQGVAPAAGSAGNFNYRVPVLDKQQLRVDADALREALSKLDKPVEEDEVIGVAANRRPAAAGLDVFGRKVESDGNGSLELGDDIDCSAEGVLTARASGYVVRNGTRLDLIPFYFVTPEAGDTRPDVNFPGAVAVVGDLVGPADIQCEDLFVLGNCEQVMVQARGDIHIGGGVVGRRQTTLEADGDVYAAFISEATVSALGDIVCSNAIVNSQLVSTGSIRVTSSKGMISGGSLAALKCIRAANIGSEFGMFTETCVGRDFLTAARLEDISRHIGMHEDNLRRIQELKRQVRLWRSRLEDLPPEKQEIYINVLRKERHSQMELHSLARRRGRLRRAISDFLDASILAVDSIYPPTRVKICDSIRDIREKLNAVTLKYNQHRGVVDEELHEDASA